MSFYRLTEYELIRTHYLHLDDDQPIATVTTGDGETVELNYFSARYMDPSTGRFLTADDQPGGDFFRQDSLNPYAYALDAPTSFIDPSGHAPVIPFIAALGKAIFASAKTKALSATATKAVSSAAALKTSSFSTTATSVTASSKALQPSILMTSKTALTPSVSKATSTHQYIAVQRGGLYRVVPSSSRLGGRATHQPFSRVLTQHSTRSASSQAGTPTPIGKPRIDGQALKQLRKAKNSQARGKFEEALKAGYIRKDSYYSGIKELNQARLAREFPNTTRRAIPIS